MDSKETQGFQVADRRFWANDEEALDRAPIPEKKYPSYVEELKSRTELAEQRLKDKLRQLTRKTRLSGNDSPGTWRDAWSAKNRISCSVFSRSSTTWSGRSQPRPMFRLSRKDCRLNLDLFLTTLKTHGVEPINPVNEPFDPRQAEAVGMIAVDEPELDQCVIEVVQKGYRVGDQLIRPARVRVGQTSPKA